MQRRLFIFIFKEYLFYILISFIFINIIYFILAISAKQYIPKKLIK